MQMQESPEVLLTAKENCYLHVEILALATYRQTESIQCFVIDLVARYGICAAHSMMVSDFVPCSLFH